MESGKSLTLNYQVEFNIRSAVPMSGRSYCKQKWDADEHGFDGFTLIFCSCLGLGFYELEGSALADGKPLE